ncbi:MAG TPA: helix-turn-helix domain-containing protein [Phenylobacterium sp.]
MTSLGKLIAQRRRALKLTQAGLAQRARVGRVTVDSLENGRTAELGYNKVARILAALSLDLRTVEAAQARPTLDDLLAEVDDDQRLNRRR